MAVDPRIHSTQNLRRWDYGPRPATLQQVSNAGYLTENQPITLTGDATGTGTTAITVELTDTGVTAGAYTNSSITVDADGRVTAASSGTSVGTVTSVTAGTGLTSSPSPITASGTLSLTVPVAVANGGTGLTAGTSGGIPYYSGTTSLASSSALLANRVVLGGGAGASPYNSTVEVLTHTINTGIGATTEACGIELGGNRTGSGAAYIDFHAAGGTDAEFRLYRDAGANGNVTIGNAGSGTLTLSCNTAAHTLVMNNVGVATFSNSVQAVYLNASQNVFAAVQGYKPGGGVWADSSDIRTKEDIADYKTGLAAVLGLNPVSFKHNGEFGTIRDNKTYIGLIANDAKDVMPEMVSFSANIFDRDGKPDNPEEILSLDATALIYALVNSCKELAARVAVLEGGAS